MSHPYFLTVAYAGAGFHGWQIQTSLRSGQGDLWKALRAFDPEAPMPQGTGRTDAGVHARAQGVLIRTARSWDSYRLLAALNAHLSADLRVMAVRPAPEGFFPRQHAVAKRYVYRLGLGPAADPLQAPSRWHVHQAQPLDLAAMAAAVPPLLGTHDFSAFRCAECAAQTPVRTLHGIGITAVEGGAELVYDFGLASPQGLGSLMPQRASYQTFSRHRPSGGAVRPALRRSWDCSTRARESG